MDAFLESGILGAIFVVNIGQLSFRMMASCFPVLFIDNYVMYVILRVSLLVEKTGVCNACWPLSWALDLGLGLQEDPAWMFELPGEGAPAGGGGDAAPPSPPPPSPPPPSPPVLQQEHAIATTHDSQQAPSAIVTEV
jgi:hypothetical protein